MPADPQDLHGSMSQTKKQEKQEKEKLKIKKTEYKKP